MPHPRLCPTSTLALVLFAACADGDPSASSGAADSTGATASGPGTGTSATAGDDDTTVADDAGSSGGADTTDDDGSTGAPGYDCGPAPACGAAGAGPTKVELQLSNLDDEVVVTVNGLRRGFWSIPTTPSRDTGRIDVSEWFARGHNELRLLGANTGGPGSLHAQVWVDDALVLDYDCSDTSCPTDVEIPLGLFVDQSVAIDSDAFPCGQQLCVWGEEEGSLYIDGNYTGARAPIEVMLPPGSYDVAIGSGTDDPPADAGPSYVHEGRLRQRNVTIADAAVELGLDDGDLVGAKDYRFLIVPIRNVQYTGGDMGVLADDVPQVLADAVDHASASMTGPWSYGTVAYGADVHPMIETTVTADADGFVAIDQTALAAAGLDTDMVADHDVIVWAYSAHHADGSPVAQQPCCAWGGGSQIWMHTGWVYEPPIIYYVFIHEWLHTTEDELILLGYSGADGVHGADEHGYASGSNGEDDFAQFYRHFIRGQVAEQGTFVGAVLGLWQ